MDLTQAKDIASIAAPFVKAIVDEFITPNIKRLAKRKGVSIQMTEHAFENHFEQYLIDSYDKYSTPNILVLGNQKRQLKDIYVPLEVVNNADDKVSKEEKHIIDSFEKDFIPFHKKVLIIDTAGMGKSTLSKRLFLAAVEQQIGVPLLIELRRLKKDSTVMDEIFRQLSMINEKTDEGFVLELISKGGFVFMLDGFDEIEHEDRRDVVANIRDFIDKARKNYFLLTSRPEDALTAFGDFVKFKIRALRKPEAYLLLQNYDSRGEVSALLIKKLKEKENSNIDEFLKNPLLVSLLFAAFEHKHTIPLKKHLFYRQVYDAFFERHDLTKGESYTRNKYSKLEIDDFHRILRFIGYRSMGLNKVEFSKDELVAIIKEAKDFCIDLKFSPSDFLKDILTKVPLFVQDGLYIKWAHKSIQEYFAASFIFTDSKSKQGKILSAITRAKGYRYMNTLDIYHSIDPSSFRKYVINTFLQDYLAGLEDLRKIWPDIDPVSAAVLLTSKYVFIRINSDKVFSEINSWRKKRGDDDIYGSLSVFHENEEKYDSLKILSGHRSDNVIINLLASKKLGFIRRYKIAKKQGDLGPEPTSDYKFLNLEWGKFYVLCAETCDDYFKEIDINLLINSFSSRGLFVDEVKANVALKAIAKEINEEQSDDFLMSGIL
ncbi:NACHT domain-containing protein [Hymenobacter armeniacus]|uniref:NACHT domain-containing protein n=1 Tax=Hymenobacter armeniacus TaxID=2771358 RepID=A0ABR8JNN7_9BACT|nr:NACHT domain-containing protein [Hymenobacter armeniacus]MBD2721611.1 NACHT domain-containing protein [Hymenobacter armeniacus]